LWRIRHFYVTKTGIPPSWMGSYRRNATTSHWSNAVSSADYLRWLADNGYPLATVEEIVTGAKDAEGVYSQYLDDASTD
jgi:hypothetical protein